MKIGPFDDKTGFKPIINTWYYNVNYKVQSMLKECCNKKL